MHQISLPKCVLTPDGSNKVVEVKVSVIDFTAHMLLMDFDEQSRALYCFHCFLPLFLLLGGFQGMPNTLRQPGPRGSMRQMTPNSSSRGVFSNFSFKSFNLTVRRLKMYILLHPGSAQTMAPRPSMGVPGPRNVPPYKYATGVRNPNPQVVQPIALQQV